MNKKEIINFLLPKIIKSLNPKKIILFGSLAKNNYNKFSDIDFAIDTDRPLSYFDFPGNFDIIDLNRVNEEFKKKILNEGIILYERKN